MAYLEDLNLFKKTLPIPIPICNLLRINQVTDAYSYRPVPPCPSLPLPKSYRFVVREGIDAVTDLKLFGIN